MQVACLHSHYKGSKAVPFIVLVDGNTCIIFRNQSNPKCADKRCDKHDKLFHGV